MSWDYEVFDMLEASKEKAVGGTADVKDILHFEQHEKPARMRAEKEQREDPEWWQGQARQFRDWLKQVSP